MLLIQLPLIGATPFTSPSLYSSCAPLACWCNICYFVDCLSLCKVISYNFGEFHLIHSFTLLGILNELIGLLCNAMQCIHYIQFVNLLCLSVSMNQGNNIEMFSLNLYNETDLISKKYTFKL